MTESLLPYDYSVGVVSVVHGETAFSITGGTPDAWRGDVLYLPSQQGWGNERIKSFSDGTGELEFPWPGPTATDVAYSLRYTGIIERSTAQSRKVLEQLGDVKAWYDIIVEDDAARLALESASNPLRSGYRVLVRLDGVIWMKETSTYGDWIGPVEFKGDKGDRGWSPVYSSVPDGARRVEQLVAWVGGEGAAPAGVGKYRGPAGLVDNIAQATDIRGPAGDISGVTPFWQGRITGDVDAAAARAGLELIKQASQTDATAGRLLTVGAFGVGGPAHLVGPDLAAVRPSGLYYCNTPTNGPVSGNGWLVVYDVTADYQYQQYITLDGTIYDNVRNAGAWRGWRRLKPEYGSNANGDYIRFPDGTQICSGRHTRASVAITGTGTTSGVFYEASPQTVTYPAAFLAGTVPRFLHSETAGNFMWSVGVAAITATQGKFWLLAASSEPSRASDVNWIAIGRWF